MKEAFKIGGYAWHAHKRFEALKDGWSFEKTVEWLKTLGIVFNETSIKRFINVYVTYLGADSPNTTLRELYALVNEQAEQLTQMPEGKIEILGNIFKALPSDDSTNPKELIRELIRAGKVDIEEFTPELATKFRREAEEVANKIKNVYSTFSSNFPPISTSLHECYIAVNQQADSLIDLPNAKARIIEKIFTALPSDDSTNLEWFTHPGLIPFLIPLLIPDN